MEYSSDIELANEFKNGDHRAFKVVFERFYRQLLVFASSIVHVDKEAEDIVITTMSKLWKIHQNFDSLVNIRAFLYITVRNQSFNFLKAKKVRDNYRKETEYLQRVESEPFLVEWMVELELLEMIRKEIDSLPKQRRTVLALYFFEHLSISEIATRMGLSQNTVNATKTQAIQQLKSKIFEKKLLEAWLLVLAWI